MTYEKILGQDFQDQNVAKRLDFEFGNFIVVKSWKFWKVPKVNLFWSEWLQNWSKCSAILIILDRTIENKLFWSLEYFLQQFMRKFDHVFWYLPWSKKMDIASSGKVLQHSKMYQNLPYKLFSYVKIKYDYCRWF